MTNDYRGEILRKDNVGKDARQGGVIEHALGLQHREVWLDCASWRTIVMPTPVAFGASRAMRLSRAMPFPTWINEAKFHLS